MTDAEKIERAVEGHEFRGDMHVLLADEVRRLRAELAARPRPDPRPLSLWAHPKTGGDYLVLGVATCSTNGPGEDRERSVVYWSFKHRGLRYRDLGEFTDGRFVEVPEA